MKIVYWAGDVTRTIALVQPGQSPQLFNKTKDYNYVIIYPKEINHPVNGSYLFKNLKIPIPQIITIMNFKMGLLSTFLKRIVPQFIFTSLNVF